jgi:hypothetical protein
VKATLGHIQETNSALQAQVMALESALITTQMAAAAATAPLLLQPPLLAPGQQAQLLQPQAPLVIGGLPMAPAAPPAAVPLVLLPQPVAGASCQLQHVAARGPGVVLQAAASEELSGQTGLQSQDFPQSMPQHMAMQHYQSDFQGSPPAHCSASPVATAAAASAAAPAAVPPTLRQPERVGSGCSSACAAAPPPAPQQPPPPQRPPLPVIVPSPEHRARLAALREFVQRHGLRELHLTGGALPQAAVQELGALVAAAAESCAAAVDVGSPPPAATSSSGRGSAHGSASDMAVAAAEEEDQAPEPANPKQHWLQVRPGPRQARSAACLPL